MHTWRGTRCGCPTPGSGRSCWTGSRGHPALRLGTPARDRLVTLYGRAIEMERQARAFFLQQVEALEEGLEREIYRELAAEEDEHIALLESGLAKTKAALGR